MCHASRGRVRIPAILILPLTLALNPQELAAQKPSAQGPAFVGRITFEQTAAGAQADAVRGLAAGKITLHLGRTAYRQDMEKGLNAGSVIRRVGSKAALRLDPRTKTAELGNHTALDEMDANVRKFMVWHFKTKLSDTGVTAKICGYDTRKYAVKQSAFVRKGASAHVWIADKLEVGRHRYRFQFRAHAPVSPIPMSIPIPRGTILKSVITENGTTVTTVATEVAAGEPPASLFAKPANYKGKGFPPPLRPAPPKPRSARVFDLTKLPRTLRNGVGMTLVRVDPGTFEMGSPKNEPGRRKHETQHEVTLSEPYYVATTEVTQAQWLAVMGAACPSKKRGANLPVESITWHQAQEFCRRLSKREGQSYRLPTEAEWEYAARAGESFAFAKMKRKERQTWLNARAWQYGNAKYRTHPVGELAANPWGIHDMLGNVAEWVADGYGPFSAQAATDPQGMIHDVKVIRGGGWVTSFEFCRPASRDRRAADQSKSTIGMRVVCDPK